MEVPIELLRAWSRGEISRHDIARQLDNEVAFADLLAGIHAHGLTLPRFPPHPGSPGVELIRRLAQQAPRE